MAKILEGRFNCFNLNNFSFDYELRLCKPGYVNTFQWFKVTIVVLFFFNFQDIRVYSEEVELDSRDAKQDYEQFKESCDSLANLMNEIQNLKANGAKEGVRYIFKERNNADILVIPELVPYTINVIILDQSCLCYWKVFCSQPNLCLRSKYKC